jgi:lipopolysaccharide transport system ATP-binding protein
MAHIRFANVDLEYPIRENQSASLKDFVLQGLLRQKKMNVLKSVKALENLTFEIHEGERVGIIGLNGAGKSTLLRSIAGIYPIIRGTRSVEGTVSSIFDISLGFEADATGWQNVYFRSYLQGEKPKDIKERLQDIEEFTELGEFLNLPIRCYSTGMLMRLAFAIATSRTTDILLIDEVFATGDLVFRKKAEARMRELLNKAQIVAMVGHNLDFLSEFCTKVIWIHKGRLYKTGPATELIQEYREEATRLRNKPAHKLLETQTSC